MGITISQTENSNEKPKETGFLSKLITNRKAKVKTFTPLTPKLLDNKLLATFNLFETKYPELTHQYIVQYHLVRTFEFPKKKRNRMSTANLVGTKVSLNNINIRPRKLTKFDSISPNNSLDLELKIPANSRPASIAQEGGQTLAEYQVVKEEFIYEFIEFEKYEYAHELATGVMLNFFDMIDEFMKRLENK